MSENLKNPGRITLEIRGAGLRVLIIGGGKAALIKARRFVASGAQVVAVAPSFTEGFEELKEQVTLREGTYRKSMIREFEIIVAAIKEEACLDEIIADCKEAHKLFLTTGFPQEGNFIIPMQSEVEGIHLSVSTGVPKFSRHLLEGWEDAVRPYGSFVSFLKKLRRKIIDTVGDEKLKADMLDYIVSEEFYRAFEKGEAFLSFKEAFGGDIFEDHHWDAAGGTGT